MVLAASSGFSFGDPFALWQLAAGLALLVAVLALRFERGRPFSPAIVYLLIGFAVALVLPSTGIDALDPVRDAELLERLAEFAVIIALFGAGLRLDRPLGWPAWRSAVLLLGITMPLTIGAVALWGTAAMGLSAGVAVLLGAVLAPTDPVLASEVQVGPPRDADEPEPHFALTSEAGLNDGLAFPFVFLGLHLVADPGGGWVTEWLLADVLLKVSVGVAGGALAGWVAGWLVLRVTEGRIVHESPGAWVAIGLVLVTYGGVEAIGGYGFLAAFAGGVAFRRFEIDHDANEGLHEGGEGVEKAAELGIVLLVGTMFTVDGLAAPGLAGWLLIPLLLLVFRPLAVLVAYARTGLPMHERLFIGWFGIRGIGSIYYVAAALSLGTVRAEDAGVLAWTVLVTVAVSIVIHGMTATPFSRHVLRD